MLSIIIALQKQPMKQYKLHTHCEKDILAVNRLEYTFSLIRPNLQLGNLSESKGALAVHHLSAIAPSSCTTCIETGLLKNFNNKLLH